MASPQLDKIPLTNLKGVGPALQSKLNNFGIRTVQDLLFHLPFRYEDRTKIESMGSIRAGYTVQLEGEIVSTSIQFGKRRSLQCVLHDGKGIVTLRFFYFNASQKDALKDGARLRCYGEVRRGRSGLEIYHPEYKVLRSDEEVEVSDALTPVYPASEGLQQNRLRNIIGQAVELLKDSAALRDYLPVELREKLGLSSLRDALLMIHRPPAEQSLQWINEGMNPGQKRLAIEELIAHRLCMRRYKVNSQNQQAPVFKNSGHLQNAFLSQLSFKLTAAQESSFAEISDDLAKASPMLRLLQGDVGSGKTVVAALAALRAIANGYQVALMAPTEILAEQHRINFDSWFADIDIDVGWLSGKVKGKARAQQLEKMESGESQLIIGTHALFQEGIVFRKLGLIIIDEQHRFGVHQRLALKEKAGQARINPHQLVMTATPIPRTLAMSAYADLDNSIIDELPPGRTPVNTAVIANERRDDVVASIRKACTENNQAYWVCTLIEESENLQCQAAEATAEQLTLQLPGITVGLIHGRMKADEKSLIMDKFKTGLIQLLVATTVIEVGVDVPNASLMVIENPERLGLAQLHQLRGRVGRGSKESHCLLLYQSPLSKAGKQRLSVLRESNDGFYIAEKDLELRGPGQVLGTEQTGLMSFRVADIVRDSGLLDEVASASELIMREHPDTIDPLIQRWLGERINYARV